MPDQLKNKARGPWFCVAVCVLHTPLHRGRREHMAANDFCEWLDHYSSSNLTSDCIMAVSFGVKEKLFWFSFCHWVVWLLSHPYSSFANFAQFSWIWKVFNFITEELGTKMNLCINFFGYSVSVSSDLLWCRFWNCTAWRSTVKGVHFFPQKGSKQTLRIEHSYCTCDYLPTNRASRVNTSLNSLGTTNTANSVATNDKCSPPSPRKTDNTELPLGYCWQILSLFLQQPILPACPWAFILGFVLIPMNTIFTNVYVDSWVNKTTLIRILEIFQLRLISL